MNFKDEAAPLPAINRAFFKVVAEKQDLIKERENLRCEMDDLRRSAGDTERDKEAVKGQMNIVTIEKTNLEKRGPIDALI